MTTVHKFRDLLAGCGVLLAWTAVAIANFYASSSQRVAVRPEVQALKLSRAFQSAAERLRGKTVELVLPADGTGSDGPTPHTELQVVGSGVIVDESGLVLTTRRTVAKGGHLRVRLPDGRLLAVGPIQVDEDSQLATVQIAESGPMQVADLGSAAKLETGDWVVAVGYSGMNEPITKPGIIQGREPVTANGTPDAFAYLTTDAAIHPRIEGAPLVDLQGAVVGLISAAPNPRLSGSTVGFAVPVDASSPWIARQLQPLPESSVQKLGIRVQPVSTDVVKRFNLGPGTGALITKVIPNTPGTEAGLQVGDVVVALGEHRVTSPSDVQVAIRSLPEGLRKPIEIVRDGWRMTMHLRIPKSVSH